MDRNDVTCAQEDGLLRKKKTNASNNRKENFFTDKINELSERKQFFDELLSRIVQP